MSKPQYIPTTWIDHVEDPATGEVTTLGTEVNAEHLNNIEMGIKAAIDAIGETDLDLSGRQEKTTIADSDGFLISDSESDPPTLMRILWSTFKARIKGYLEVVFVPLSRKINGKTLSADITLAAGDVGAPPKSHASTATAYGVGSPTDFGHVRVTANNGLKITNGTVSMDAASPSTAGAVTTGSQTIAGAKTFAGVVTVANPAAGTKASRNSYAGTSAMTPGTTPLESGVVYYQYE